MRRSTVSEETFLGGEPSTSRRPISRFLDGRAYDEDDLYLPDRQYSLTCGIAHTEQRTRPLESFIPSLLPLDPTQTSAPTPTPTHLDYKRSNGCGRTLLLTYIQPSSDDNVWLAQSPSSSDLEEDVVTLDRRYHASLDSFGDSVTEWAQEVTYSCGCVEGGIVACRHCGNILGTQRKCCPPYRVCALRGRGRHRPRAEGRKVVYSILASAVTSSPSHSFPPTSGHRRQFLQPRYRPMIYASPEPLASSVHLPLSPPQQHPSDGLVTPPNRTISLSDVFASLPSINPDNVSWLPYNSAEESQRPSNNIPSDVPVSSTRSVTPFPAVTTPRSETNSDVTDSSQTPMRFAIPAEIIELLRSRPRTPPVERSSTTRIHSTGSDDMFALAASPPYNPPDSNRHSASEMRPPFGVSGRAYTPFNLGQLERTLGMPEVNITQRVSPYPDRLDEEDPGIGTPQPHRSMDSDSHSASKQNIGELSRQSIHITAAR
jgi:hypothetical protein